MLIICEDCAKRYNIDESRIKGNRARFTCKECGHIIIVDKSDLTRPLISASYTSRIPQDENGGAIDLLKEMEVAAGPPEEEDAPEAPAEAESGEGIKTPQQGLPFFLYILPALAVAFLCTSGVLGYLYFEYIAESMARTGTTTDFLVISFLLLGLSWILSLAVLFVAVRVAAGAVIRVKEDVLGILRGEKGPEVSVRGPREVRELAVVLREKFRLRR